MDLPKNLWKKPKPWQQECETYFELYQIVPTLRTRYKSLTFKGTAALWLCSVEIKGKI
jgi:hypothetical protein